MACTQFFYCNFCANLLVLLYFASIFYFYFINLFSIMSSALALIEEWQEEARYLSIETPRGNPAATTGWAQADAIWRTMPKIGILATFPKDFLDMLRANLRDWGVEGILDGPKPDLTRNVRGGVKKFLMWPRTEYPPWETLSPRTLAIS